LAVRLQLILVALAVLYGCGQASSPVEREVKKAEAKRPNKTEASLPTPEPTSQPNTSAKGGITVGKKIAQAKLKSVGDTGTSGTVVLKEVGNLGTQVELDVAGLPTMNPNASYYAQVHKGSCSDERRGEEHGKAEEYGAGLGSVPALVKLDQLVAKIRGLEAHGGHEHGIPEVPFGSIEQPISFSASADGTSSVTSLLEGVEAKLLTSGDPEYVHLHGVDSEDAPELACGDLVGASGRGLDKP
jgi:hypothetical protein